MLLFVLMLTSCISNIVSWFVLHVRGQYWPFAFILNKIKEQVRQANKIASWVGGINKSAVHFTMCCLLPSLL